MSFTLKNISVELILKKHNMFQPTKNVKPLQKTFLSNTSVKHPSVISFLDETNHEKQCQFNFANLTTTENKKYRCYWCRHDIQHSPIGVPIKFVYNEKIKSYHSELNNIVYTIYESSIENPEKNEKKNVSFVKKNYYVVSDLCCSWNCAMALIHDERSNSKYRFSSMLLYQMYKQINGLHPDQNVVIKPAPHWKLLSVHGGPLTIDMFRSKFNKYEYIEHGTMNVNYKFISNLFESKLSFN